MQQPHAVQSWSDFARYLTDCVRDLRRDPRGYEDPHLGSLLEHLAAWVLESWGDPRADWPLLASILAAARASAASRYD